MTRHQQAFTSFAERHQRGDLLHPSIIYPGFAAPTLTHFSLLAPLTSPALGSPPHMPGASGWVAADSVGWSPEVPSKTPPPAQYPGHGHGLHVHQGWLKHCVFWSPTGLFNGWALWDDEKEGESRCFMAPFDRYFQQLSLCWRST